MKVTLHAAGMQHGSFGDLYLNAVNDDDRRQALHNLALTEEVTRAFLDKHLKGSSTTLFDDRRSWPEIAIKRY